MPRPKSNKTVTSINFDNDVLEALNEKCRKEKINKSTFVNFLVRGAVMSDKEYYRMQAKYHSKKFHEFKYLSDTSPEE